MSTPSTHILGTNYHSPLKGKRKKEKGLLGEITGSSARQGKYKMSLDHFTVSQSKCSRNDIGASFEQQNSDNNG